MKKQEQEVQPQIVLKLISGKENILAAIGQVTVTGQTLQTLLHTVAVSILLHVDKHREVSLVNKLIDAVPNMARKNALRDWFSAFGKMTYDQETKVMVFKKTAKTNSIQATQTPFWEFVPEKAYVPFDLLAAIGVLVTRAEKTAEKNNRADKIPADKLAALRKLVA